MCLLPHAGGHEHFHGLAFAIHYVVRLHKDGNQIIPGNLDALLRILLFIIHVD